MSLNWYKQNRVWVFIMFIELQRENWLQFSHWLKFTPSQFHYKYVRSKYGDQAKLLFENTDSLCYHIQTEDVYKDMEEDQDLFDMSDYPKDHLLHSNTNKKDIGKLNDEIVGETLWELIGLRAKLCSFMMDRGKEKKTAKGMKKSVEDWEMKHWDLKDCLFNKVPKQHSMMGFTLDCHQIFTEGLVSSFSDSCSRALLLFALVTKSLVDPFLILGIITWFIIVDFFFLFFFAATTFVLMLPVLLSLLLQVPLRSYYFPPLALLHFHHCFLPRENQKDLLYSWSFFSCGPFTQDSLLQMSQIDWSTF